MAKGKPLVGPLLHRFIECCLRDVDVPNGRNGPTYVQGVFIPHYNVCPTDPVGTIVADEGKRELMRARWGLIPAWWKKPLKELELATFNARAETVTTKPFFKYAFKRKRCLIPVSGYYEWQDTPSGKQPWYFTARDGSPALTIAGLWDEWKNLETGEPVKSRTMIITDPNKFVAEVHDRMPATDKDVLQK